MRLKVTKTKTCETLYVIKSTYINQKHSSKVIERLGSIDEIKSKIGSKDPYLWANEYIAKLNKQEKDDSRTITKSFSPNKLRDTSRQPTFNAGYLFLQDIYYSLGLDDICNEITNKYQFKYDLNSILSNLIYSRIIFPSSKLKTLDICKTFIEQPNFEYQHILRALGVISKEANFIQSELYKNSLKYSKRNDRILFYDCTNYYFEVEEEDDLRKYGKSKENRPNPIVGMGLFMDGDGIPLAFSTFPGNTNEQVTLKPLEETIINDFGNSKFVVCTDAGLASNTNRKFNNTNDRRFVTTQSLKKLKSFLNTWALELDKGWKLPGSDKVYDISKLRDDEALINKYYNKFFYKERWIKEDGLEQRLIITFSPKFQEYQKRIREKQVSRALKLLQSSPRKLGKVNANDPKRFITVTNITENGEIAEDSIYQLNQNSIDDEAKYDGLYAVCTNLEDSVEEIIKINKRRWEIEENFRIMKSEFDARPVYLSRSDRIKAHFTTCFLSLIIYRYLEKKLNNEFTTTEIIETLRNLNYLEIPDEGYVPTFPRTKITDILYSKNHLKDDCEIITIKKIRNFIKLSKLK